MSQDTLRALWHTSAPGRLTPWQQARALAFREASREIYGGHVAVNWIAGFLKKTDDAGTAYTDLSPSHQSLNEFFNKVDADPDWFPGKHSGTKRGPKPLLSKSKRARIASSAMTQKREGFEPSVEVTIQRCPSATLNPKTDKPFCDKTVRKVFLEDCYDFDPDHPWKLQSPLQKTFLPDDVKEHRCNMCRYILENADNGDSVQWWARYVLWIDPCASILARSRRKYDKMRRAEMGNRKRYISDNARMYNRNLRQPKEVLKQNSFDTERISWLMVLARGKVAVEMLPEDWYVNGEGMAAAVTRLPVILRRMLGADAVLPRVLFTDRGTGMYAPSGKVVREYNRATTAAGFHLYWSEDAAKQAPDMGDLLLHETAVAWFRNRMRRTKPIVHPWEESRSQWAERAASCVRAVNAENDVSGLCREFPMRLSACLEQGGERLSK